MRSFLAAALVAAAVLPTAASASAGSGDASCLDPLFASSAPRFIRHEEMAGYYVDTPAVGAFAEAQPARAAAAARCLAGSVPATDGCVTRFLGGDSPSTHVVTTDPEGRVIVDPHGADAFAAATVNGAVGLVLCVV
jgi:hypothetical protein